MNSIKKHSLFPIELFESNIELNNQELINKLYNLKQLNKQNVSSNSSGGWQSERNFYIYPESQILNNTIKSLIQNIFHPNCKILDMWGSIYSKGDFNNIHNHPPLQYTNNPLWSGVYYLKTFPNSGAFHIHSNNNITDKVTFYPKENDLFLFNSTTYHSVDPNTENEDRICIAFNLQLI
jgi:hypothetical protein